MANILANRGAWFLSANIHDAGTSWEFDLVTNEEMVYGGSSAPGDTIDGYFTNYGEDFYYVSIRLNGVQQIAYNVNAGANSHIQYTIESSGEWSIVIYTNFGTATGDITPGSGGGGDTYSSTPIEGYYVYELNKGWTFDGFYIPHYIILNWYFGENPTVYKTMQKVRVHGLAKGTTTLQVQTNGIQTDYRQDFSEPEHFDLKNPYELIYEEFVPATEYADLSNRGLAIQIKFEGRNTNALLPEPSHVLQVLVPQTSPSGNGFSSN